MTATVHGGNVVAVMQPDQLEDRCTLSPQEDPGFIIQATQSGQWFIMGFVQRPRVALSLTPVISHSSLFYFLSDLYSALTSPFALMLSYSDIRPLSHNLKAA